MQLKRQQVAAVAGYEVVGGGCDGALENSVVGVTAFNHILKARRVDDGGSIMQHSESLQ